MKEGVPSAGIPARLWRGTYIKALLVHWNLCPREESDLDLLLRRESFYPLNYGDGLNINSYFIKHLGISLLYPLRRFSSYCENVGEPPTASLIIYGVGFVLRGEIKTSTLYKVLNSSRKIKRRKTIFRKAFSWWWKSPSHLQVPACLSEVLVPLPLPHP